MTRQNDYDDPASRAPAVAHGRPASGPLSPTWVDADRAEVVPSHWAKAEPPAVIQYMPPAAANTDAAWRSPDSTAEVGSPSNRAWATVIRGLPLLALAVPAAWGLAWVTSTGWAFGLLFFAGLAVASYLGVVLLDLRHNSPFSTERHRIDKAAELKRLELKQTHELRRAVVESFLDHLDGEGGGHA